MSYHESVKSLLGRMLDWWSRRYELSDVDPKELERVAGELSISAGILEDLVARGPDAADHLYARMYALGLSRADVDHAATGVLRDLQRTCACCNEQRRCEKDLVGRPDDPVWKGYCPNATTLDALTRLKDRCRVSSLRSPRAASPG
jgi:hypothetical protein